MALLDIAMDDLLMHIEMSLENAGGDPQARFKNFVSAIALHNTRRRDLAMLHDEFRFLGHEARARYVAKRSVVQQTLENLLEAGNILGSIFYGSILGLFLTAFFIRRVTGSAVFFAALIAQTLVFVLFATTNIGYLWYNFIGCAAVLILAPILQQTLFRSAEASAGV